MATELARDLINAGVHFGHGASRWNPKMKPYIFAKRGTIHIIDVRETLKGLILGQKLLANVVSSGKDVVFVGTKRQARKAVQDAAMKCGMHYVSERWLGGMLTNFRTIRGRLQRLEQLEDMEAKGTLEKESKKQAARWKREMLKIQTNLNGIRKMSKAPGVVVVVDVNKEHLALREAKKLGIYTIGIIDTDSDPDCVDVAIPANDDSIKAVALLLGRLSDAVLEGKNNAAMIAKQRPEVSEAKPRSKRRGMVTAEGEVAVPAVTEVKAEEAEAVSEPVEAANDEAVEGQA